MAQSARSNKTGNKNHDAHLDANGHYRCFSHFDVIRKGSPAQTAGSEAGPAHSETNYGKPSDAGSAMVALTEKDETESGSPVSTPPMSTAPVDDDTGSGRASPRSDPFTRPSDTEFPRNHDQADRRAGPDDGEIRIDDFRYDLHVARDTGVHIPRWVEQANIVPDTTPMFLTLAGDAIAVGENTYASGSIFTDVVDLGPVVIARGVVDFAGRAEGPGAYAAAMTMADAVGYDLLYIWDLARPLTTDGRNGSGQAGEHSLTMVVAIDFENFDFADGPIEIYGNRTQLPEFLSDLLAGVSLPPNTIDGNVGVLQIGADAMGANTLADATASVFTIEDQLSTVTGDVIIGVA